jgi:hypothetical protein
MLLLLPPLLPRSVKRHVDCRSSKIYAMAHTLRVVIAPITAKNNRQHKSGPPESQLVCEIDTV